MMMNTESVGVMDVEMCKKFLRWIEDNGQEKKKSHWENMLKEVDDSPMEMFISGLKRMGEVLEHVDTNPIARITTNPVGIFQTGMLLGYCMSRASAHPDFAQMLLDLENKTKNVTSILAAKKASK